MKAHIVRIGNSRGIRLPKTLLQEAQLEDEVDLQAEPGRILISKTAKPRAGWAEAARRMRARGEDRLLDPPTLTRFDKEGWKWR
jgi:antitoxin MazE